VDEQNNAGRVGGGQALVVDQRQPPGVRHGDARHELRIVREAPSAVFAQKSARLRRVALMISIFMTSFAPARRPEARPRPAETMTENQVPVHRGRRGHGIRAQPSDSNEAVDVPEIVTIGGHTTLLALTPICQPRWKNAIPVSSPQFGQ
jgi:hypothetical protein